MAKQTKISQITDEVFDLLIEGQTFRDIAEYFGVKLGILSYFFAKPEHSARVQVCLIFSADTCADNAQKALESISDDAKLGEITRQRELAQYWKWKARCRNPKRWGDRLEVDNINPTESPTPIINIHLAPESKEKAQKIAKPKKP